MHSVCSSCGYGTDASDMMPEIGAAVSTEGEALGLCTVSCVDTDGSLTIEDIGSLPSLTNFGATYGRGYDSYTIGSPGVVPRSVDYCDCTVGSAKTAP